MTEENLLEVLSQSERRLVNLYAAMRNNPEIMKILEEKNFATIEKKQATVAATTYPRRTMKSEEPEEMEIDDREQREEMIQQLNERNKLKHEALNRYEKKLKMKAKKPKTAVGQRRGFF